jgi:non-heme chloroperoxidase
MDTYAADVAELTRHLDLKNAVHIGHSTGGGEVARYVARHGHGRVAAAVFISSVVPGLIKSASNPDGVPIEALDDIRKQTAAHRAQYYEDFTIPFYGYNRPGAVISQGVRDNWWRQGMMGGIKAHYDCIKAFSETDFTEDLKAIDVPVLVMHGEDDQIVPYAASAPRTMKLVKHGTLKSYPGFPHGMPVTQGEQIAADLFDFIQKLKTKASVAA